MYLETVEHFARYAARKRDAAGSTPFRFFVASMMAGGYVGLAIILITMLGDHPETVTMGGFIHNMLWVTIGNAIAGVLFLGFGYWFVARPDHAMVAPLAAREAHP
jgi:nitrite transporter NirC